MVSKLCEEQNIREVSESLLTAPNEVEKYAKIMKSNSSDNCVHHYNNKNLFDPELQLINSKVMIKNKDN